MRRRVCSSTVPSPRIGRRVEHDADRAAPAARSASTARPCPSSRWWATAAASAGERRPGACSPAACPRNATHHGSFSVAHCATPSAERIGDVGGVLGEPRRHVAVAPAAGVLQLLRMVPVEQRRRRRRCRRRRAGRRGGGTARGRPSSPASRRRRRRAPTRSRSGRRAGRGRPSARRRRPSAGGGRRRRRRRCRRRSPRARG